MGVCATDPEPPSPVSSSEAGGAIYTASVGASGRQTPETGSFAPWHVLCFRFEIGYPAAPRNVIHGPRYALAGGNPSGG